jgi:glycosyltransferase involved in cell wall biosynthesis/peptidoglycan/xylan/chitin deacetylase (PgdA/CDA1 family)
MRALKLSRLPRRVFSRLFRLVRSRWVNFRRRRLSLPLWRTRRWVHQLWRGQDSTPLVSVIIPAHNAAITLAKTLESLISQRIGAWEAIIVDDGSTDRTPQLVASWRERDSRFHYVRQARAGVSRARNTGLMHVGAERVMFLDADDWIAPDYLAQMFAAVAENPKADVIYCGYIRIADDGRELPMSFSWDVAIAPFEAFGNYCAVAIHCLVLRRRVVVQAGGFDADLKTSEDWDLWLRVARTGALFVGVPLPLAYYRMRPGSATSNYVHMINDARWVIERSRSADPRVKRPDPRYVNGLPDNAVIERWVYFGIWCAACEAANGRNGLPALDLLDRIPDMKEEADGISGCLFHGLCVGGRRPPWALMEIWRSAESCLLDICRRIESASSRLGLTRCIMEHLETRVMRASDLATPQTLWRMRGYRIDVRGPVPDIEPMPYLDNVYLRIVDGKTWLDEIHYPLLGAIGSRDLAHLILETWGFEGCLGSGPLAMRLVLIREVATEVAQRTANLLRLSQDRRQQLLNILNIVWRGFRSGALLAAASRPTSVPGPEPTYREPAGIVINRYQNDSLPRIGAPSAPLAINSCHAPSEALTAASTMMRRAAWDQRFETPDPWNYASPYERKKYDRTLELLPDELIKQAMELACAEGHFTDRLAARVKSLVAIDISEKALERARLRCRHHANVQFRCLDLIDDAIPGEMDLIVCSEVLYFLENIDALREITEKLKRALAPGGRLLAAHAFVLSDDPDQTGFDWNNPFGARVIDQVLSTTAGLRKEKSLITDLYRIDLYRREWVGLPELTPDIQEAPLDSPLKLEIERQIVWGGATVRRSEAIRNETTERIPVLMYHRVSSAGAVELARYRVYPHAFEQQLRFLRQQGYYTVSADTLLDAIRSGQSLQGRPIMLTFDDAYRDFYETAWPLLQRYDFTAQVFVVTKKVSGCADWDSGYGEPAPLMGWDEIEALSRSGVAFGSHLATHHAADCLSTEELLNEGASSRYELETRLKTEVHAVAFPFGIHSPRVINTLRLCGYQIGFTTSDGISSIRMDPMVLPRLEIMGSDSLEDFACKIRRHDVVRRAHL